jgi:hypothetical protein
MAFNSETRRRTAVLRLAEEHDDEWRRHHAERRGTHCRLAQLAQVRSAEGDFERGTILEKLRKCEEALVAYQSALDRDGNHGRACLAVGRILLSKGDEAGATLVERSMQITEELVPDARAILADYCEWRSRPADALL